MTCSVLRRFLAMGLVALALPLYAEITLIPTGAIWKYLDNGSDPGSLWTGRTFNDSAWAFGPAQLGYGDGDEATTNSFGPDPDNKYITTWYRRAFTIDDLSIVTNALLRLLCDDGAVVFVNGFEVYRSNMPAGTITSATLATTSITGIEEVGFLRAFINPAPFVKGANVLAVEIHQADTVSTDISFDLALLANVSTRPALVHPGSVWNYRDDGVLPDPQWRDPNYNDASWKAGPAQLGFGDGDEATRLDSGPSTNVFLAYYFRHHFNVPDLAAISNLVVRVLRDDGALVYLNGSEIFRNNMPAGPIDASTPATAIVNAPQESQFYARRVDPALLRAGPNVLAVEIHQGNTTSGDVSFDLELLPNVESSPPEVAITAPSNNTDYVAPAEVLISATATDFDGIITNVLFVTDGAAVGRTAAEPYSVICSNHPAGMHVLHAVATDDAGFSTTSAPVHIRVLAPPVLVSLVTNGSYWRYLDNGSDPGSLWRTAGFPDSSWLFNRAEFGYGDQDEATTVQPQMTHYFRRKFTVARAADFTNLLFRVLRDDGVVVYLNNNEAFRMNMPLGPIDPLTPASAPVGSTNETFYFPTNLPATFLVDGTNTLAVELHQTAGSLDGSFDLALTGIGPASGSVIRLAFEQDGNKLLLRWTDPNALLEESPVPGSGWATLTNAVSPYEVSNTVSRLFRLRTPPSAPGF
jgi:hypothetical protein